MRLSSIFYKIEVVFHFYKIEVVFHFYKIEVVFHILSRWGKIMLHTRNQLPRLPRTARIVIISGVVVWSFLAILIPPQQKLFTLGCGLVCGNIHVWLIPYLTIMIITSQCVHDAQVIMFNNLLAQASQGVILQ
jgi:hypothetical protein